ncbi:uncharacterized protein [Solanum lycopersicum]|uniref:DUF7794 domain-containing protein n=1 Tax=Solanum lycopersicum TaxID=4081 RepID=A0A3Q7J436_SOLLC|nr:uncharacterized protein LOC101262457 [Solanum lycopersicum]
MDPKSSYKFTFLLLLSLFLHSKVADGTSSVYFIDNPSHRYFRSPSSDASSKISSLSLSDVGATVSILLGFAPPATLSSASSSKLNEVLVPNPFDRPGSVLILEVTGAEGVAFEALRSNVVNENRADIQLPDADKVSLFSLDEPKTDAEHSEKELSEFASWLSGSYVNGELTIPLEDDANLKFQLSKEADRDFVTSLVSLTHKIQRAMEKHQDLSGAVHHPSELISGKFDGLKALKEQYGAEGVVEGAKLFSIVMSKMFDSLTEAYKGQIVGVIVCNETPSVAEPLFDVVFTSQPSARWLEETQTSPNSTAVEEVILVRRTVAWITGLLLIIATLLGIYFLLNMPLTRDTLLYSNVKLD